MGSWRGFLSLAFVLVACGPGGHGGDDTGDAGPPDSPPPADAFVPGNDAPPVDVEMYAHSRDTLFRVDADTFAVTIIGTFDIADGDLVTDLAVTPNGILYGISETKLYTIDKTTGVATYRADVPGVDNVGLTYLPDGTLLATDKSGGIRRVDPVNGAVTEIGAFGGGFATAGDLVAVVDGTMYAISDEGPNGDEFTNNWLLTVDTSTGTATPVGQIGYGKVFGCAYAKGHVYAFTSMGEIVEIDRLTGAGTLVKTQPVEFWGAGVSPLVPVID